MMKVKLTSDSDSHRAWLRNNNHPMPLSQMYAQTIYEPWWRESVLGSIAAAERMQETRCLQVGRRCFLTGKKLFLKKAVRVSAKMSNGHALFIDNEVWIDQKEYLLLLLKGG